MKHAYIIYALIAIVIGIIILHFTGITEYVTLENLQQRKQDWSDFVQHHYLEAILGYIVVNAFIIVACIPIAMPMALMGGLLFGTIAGGIYALMGVVLGSLVAFLLFRYLLYALIYRRYTAILTRLNARLEKFGVTYLLMLYYSAVIPYFMINACAALSNISLATFTIIVILGSLPLTFICSFAGGRLSTISSIYDIFSPTIIWLLIGLIAIAYIPIIVRRYMARQRGDEDDTTL